MGMGHRSDRRAAACSSRPAGDPVDDVRLLDGRFATEACLPVSWTTVISEDGRNGPQDAWFARQHRLAA